VRSRKTRLRPSATSSREADDRDHVVALGQLTHGRGCPLGAAGAVAYFESDTRPRRRACGVVADLLRARDLVEDPGRQQDPPQTLLAKARERAGKWQHDAQRARSALDTRGGKPADLGEGREHPRGGELLEKCRAADELAA